MDASEYSGGKTGGYVLMFTDWRQLPTATDALQGGGFIWRGIIAWDKGLGARGVHIGYFRHQCEYLVWGTNGALPVAGTGPYPGAFQVPTLQSDKYHLTGKPTRLMQQLVRCVPPGATVLDPFMGSGTTGVACVLEGRDFIGVELDANHYATARRRIDNATKQAPLPFILPTMSQAQADLVLLPGA